jgi:hypothetical protein
LQKLLNDSIVKLNYVKTGIIERGRGKLKWQTCYFSDDFLAGEWWTIHPAVMVGSTNTHNFLN